eukprot:TRINITY_DN24980_c0_g2_i1.p1 TRINITY_DN24980_c0_g2~~TRINITY_DN24980_c0_g2_i1.p1  ORF type:complete len:332 (+),score=64.49 TRINITY_DN24980_c0_g2_i1:1-996(+)
MAPQVDAHSSIGALPGQRRFEWHAAAALARAGKPDVCIFGSEWLPYNCRIVEFGRSVRLYAEKSVGVAAVPPSETGRTCALLESVLPPHGPWSRLAFSPLNHVMIVTLWPSNQAIHPARMYGMVSQQQDELWDENPLFYEGMDAVSASQICGVDDDIQAIVRGLTRRSGISLEVLPIKEAYIRAYPDQIADRSTLQTCIASNAGYVGIKSPMIPADWPLNRLKVDYAHRYFTEDVPNGLCTLKAIADMVGVFVPKIDEVITWAQRKMGKEYIVNGRLAGENAHECCVPQRYGINNVEQLMGVPAARGSLAPSPPRRFMCSGLEYAANRSRL